MPTSFDDFLNSGDFSDHSRRAFRSDFRNFVQWFEVRNKERFSLNRTTTRDIVDFRNHLQTVEKKAVSSINRNLVTIRRFFQWSVDQGMMMSNPAKGVKEIKKVCPNLKIKSTHWSKFISFESIILADRGIFATAMLNPILNLSVSKRKTMLATISKRTSDIPSGLLFQDDIE